MSLYQDQQQQAMGRFAKRLLRGEEDPSNWPHVDPGVRLDGMVLRGIDFSAADLRQVSFRQSDLTDCNFGGADLIGADFTGAILLRTKWGQADLTEAKLADVVFETGTVERFVSKVLSDGARYDLIRYKGSGKIEYHVGSASSFTSLDFAIVLGLLSDSLIQQIQLLLSDGDTEEDQWVQL